MQSFWQVRLCPAVGLSCPRPKSPRSHPGPRSQRGLGDCAPSFLGCTDPRRTGDPQKMADYWRGRPKAKARADDPLASVVLGTGKMLSDFKLLRKISID